MVRACKRASERALGRDQPGEVDDDKQIRRRAWLRGWAVGVKEAIRYRLPVAERMQGCRGTTEAKGNWGRQAREEMSWWPKMASEVPGEAQVCGGASCKLLYVRAYPVGYLG